MQENGLQKGFITISEAIDLINKDTRDNATVDVAFLVKGIPYLRKDGNYTIPLLKHENGHIVPNGERFVHINSEYERVQLEHTIVEHYKKASGDTNYDPQAVTKSLSTVVDDEENPKGALVEQKKPMTKVGEDIQNHAIETTNGE